MAHGPCASEQAQGFTHHSLVWLVFSGVRSPGPFALTTGGVGRIGAIVAWAGGSGWVLVKWSGCYFQIVGLVKAVPACQA